MKDRKRIMLQVPIEEAADKRVTRRRKSSVLDKYKRYIEKLQPDKAGKLIVDSNKEGYRVRRRLERAAEEMGQEVVIKKVGPDLYFWRTELNTGKEEDN